MLHNAQVYISEQYNTRFLLTSLTYATTLSVKTFPGRLSATPWGAAPSNLLHTTLALSTTLTNFGKKFPLNIGYSIVIKKLLIACLQISPVQEGRFGVNMMYHATL